MPAWVTAGFAEYADRLTRELRLVLTEIPPAHRTVGTPVERLRQLEAERLLKAVPPGAEVIALDERGRALDTAAWAQALGRWLQSGRDVAMLVGGPDGLAAELRDRADHCWSLSPLTLPHPLVRVLVAEQLYRAYSLHTRHPYHRA